MPILVPGRRSTALLGLLTALSVACGVRAGTNDQREQQRIVEFTTAEATNVSVDVSPDGRTVVFDLLGDIYAVAIEGGEARSLLAGPSFDYQPQFSPDGAQLAFLSDRGGQRMLWMVKADGADPQPSRGDPPKWWRRYSHLQIGNEIVCHPVTSPADSMLVVLGSDSESCRVLKVRDLRTGADRVLLDSLAPQTEDGPPRWAITPDGRFAVVGRQGRLMKVDLVSGETAEIPFRARVRHVLAPRAAPQHALGNGPTVRARVVRWLSLNQDRSRAVFSAFGKLYETNLANGTSRRLTNSDDLEYAPAMSPDGNWIAYATWSDTGRGHVQIIPARGGNARRLTREAGRYANPAWSPDGKRLAFVAGSDSLDRTDEAFRLLWVRLDEEGMRPQLIARVRPPVYGTPIRNYPVVSFTASGSRVFFTAPTGQGYESKRPWFPLRLVSANLDGSDQRDHLRLPLMDAVVVSPDGRFVALSRHEHVMLAPMPDSGDAPLELHLDEPRAPVISLTRAGGAYVSWADSATLVWNAGMRIHSHSVEARRTQVIADLAIETPRAHHDRTVAWTNARIVTMRGTEVIERGTLVVRGDRIVALGPTARVRIPRKTHVIDAAGKTILPGFGDMHAHVHFTDRELFLQQSPDYVAALAYGVTTIYDPSAPTMDVFSRADMVEAGLLLGPRVYSAGIPVLGNAPGHMQQLLIRSLDHAREVVGRYSRYGAVLLKEYLQPDRRQRRWLAQAAGEAGIGITAEGFTTEFDISRVTDGYTAIEHRPIRESFDDVIQFFARAGVHSTPTLLTYRLGDYMRAHERPHEDAKLRRFLPPMRMRPRGSVGAEQGPPLEDARVAARVAQAGGAITPGSHVRFTGVATHWELWGMVMGGVSNHEALRAGTLTAAAKLGLERELGSLEVGKAADYIVLDRNPLEDIRNTATIRYVVSRGFIYEAESMRRIWPDTMPLRPFYWNREASAR